MARILAVDDNADILELIRVNLTLAGHDVRVADSGQRGLDAARASRPDLVVLDVMMPEVDGWHVLERLKTEAALVDVPVIMLTARSAESDRVRGGIEGAIRYLTKPFEPDRLREEVEAALAGDPEPVQRRRVQRESLAELARMEKGVVASEGEWARPRLTRLEHAVEDEGSSTLREARERLVQLSTKQHALLEVLRGAPSVSHAAMELGVSRSNVYASLRRISRKLGTGSVRELLALLRTGALLPDAGA